MINHQLSDERLAKFRSDAQRMVDADSPVSDREWWITCLNAVAELEERRKQPLESSLLNKIRSSEGAL